MASFMHSGSNPMDHGLNGNGINAQQNADASEPVDVNDREQDHCEQGESANALVELLGDFLTRNASDEIDCDTLESICDCFRKLHARLRIKHASSFISAQDENSLIPPEQAREWQRLYAEYMPLMAMIDRVLRAAEAVIDCGMSDTEVLYLRMHEIVAITKRHLAEEEILLCKAIWQDTGGES